MSRKFLMWSFWYIPWKWFDLPHLSQLKIALHNPLWLDRLNLLILWLCKIYHVRLYWFQTVSNKILYCPWDKNFYESHWCVYFNMWSLQLIISVTLKYSVYSFGVPLIRSMGFCKKDITPLLTHWSYVFLALTHWDDIYWHLIPIW